MLLYVDVGQKARTTYWMLGKDARDMDKKHTLFTESTWGFRTEYPLVDIWALRVWYKRYVEICPELKPKTRKPSPERQPGSLFA